MAISIFLSNNDNNIQLAFYDPNVTLCVHWCVFSSIKVVENLLLEELFIFSDQFKASFDQGLSQEEGECVGCLLSSDSTENLESCYVEVDGVISSIMIFFLMESGHFGHEVIRNLLRPYEDCCFLSKKILAGERSDGVPGLYYTVKYRHVESLSYYMELVSRSSLNRWDKIQLMNGKIKNNRSGYTCLIRIIINPSLETARFAKLFVDMLFQFYSTDYFIITEVLGSKDSKGFCFFWYAMSLTDVICVKDFMHAVLNSRLDNENILKLFSGQNYYFCSAPCVAMARCLYDNVFFYIQKILNSSLSKDVIYKLLTLKNEYNKTLFSIALANGNSEFINFFVREIANSFHLEESVKIDILLSKSEVIGCSGLYFVIDMKKVEIVRTFIEKVLSSMLSEEAKTCLLISQDNTGLSVWYYAKRREDRACFDMYVEIIGQSSLGSTHKKALLAEMGVYEE